jgi:hypothetical protein
MTKHIADDQDALLDYLYEEGDPADRLRIAHHLQDCANCSVAVLELQSVRGMLSDWTPPASRLSYRIVSDEAEDTPQPHLPWWKPGGLSWAQAAAAVMLFASGMAVSQLDMDYAGGTLTVRSRAAVPASAASVVAPAASVAPTPVSSPSQNFAALEQELRSELASARTGSSAGSQTDADALLRRVQAMINQSEARQQRELALRLTDVVRDFDTQRRADLLQVQQNFGQLEGQTGAEVAQQRELLNYLVRTAGGGSQ